MAEQERQDISSRTKRALAEIKKKGTKLGYDNPKVKAGVKKYWKNKKRITKAEAKTDLKQKKKSKKSKPLNQREKFDKSIEMLFKSYKQDNLSISQITNKLNSLNMPSRENKVWHRTQVHRVLKRLGLS